MDLATLLSRVDARQIPTVKTFLDTAALIPAGEQQFWGSDPEGIREVSACTCPHVLNCRQFICLTLQSEPGLICSAICSLCNSKRPQQACCVLCTLTLCHVLMLLIRKLVFIAIKATGRAAAAPYRLRDAILLKWASLFRLGVQSTCHAGRG